MTFIDLPLELNGEALIASIYEDMASRFPGWEASEASPEAFLVRAMVYRLVIPLAQLAADVGEEVFSKFGQQIAGVPTVEAASASVTSTWTMTDNAGYTIPAGLEVDIATSGDTAVGFRVLSEVLVPPGSTTTAAGAVTLVAILPGEDGNGLTGVATPVQSLIGFQSIALVGSTSGGADAEDPAIYLTRLAETLQTFGPHPILPRDVEIIALAHSGVARAVALDMFNPATDDANDTSTWDSEKHCSFVVVDASGEGLSSPVKTAILAELTAKRESNFVFHAVDPTYTTIKVRFTVVPRTGYALADVNASVVAALQDLLSPAKWGIDERGSWINDRVVRFQDLVTAVNSLQGVEHYTLLESGAGGGAYGTSDLTLTGAAPLPRPGAIAAV